LYTKTGPKSREIGAAARRQGNLQICCMNLQKSHLRKNAAALGSTACQIVPAASPRGASIENKIAWKI